MKGEQAWAVVGLTQSVDENYPSLTTEFQVYAVAPTLQAAKDVAWDIGPYLSDTLSLTIVETTLTDR
jgi:hypothetical protein